MQSDIMTVLNDALKERQNVMIQGLPGTGKTSIVLQWLEDHREEINGVFIDGASLNLRLLSETSRRLNGLTVKGSSLLRMSLHPSGSRIRSSCSTIIRPAAGT